MNSAVAQEPSDDCGEDGLCCLYLVSACLGLEGTLRVWEKEGWRRTKLRLVK